jgi:uncharacterized membrane protein YfcA
MQVLILIILGVAAGVLSGLVGIGGGILLVPGLVFVIGLSQHRAQGTTLALMVPPVGIMAAWAYWRRRNPGYGSVGSGTANCDSTGRNSNDATELECSWKLAVGSK